MEQAQINNASTMQQRERDVFFRLGDGAHEALRQQRAHVVHKQQQLVHEGEALMMFVIMWNRSSASSRTLEPVSEDRDMARQEA